MRHAPRPIALALRARGYDVAALARACGVQPATVRAWDDGRRRLSYSRSPAFTSLLGIEATRAIYAALARPAGPGRGRLPAKGSKRARASHRATIEELRALGHADLAAAVAAELQEE